MKFRLPQITTNRVIIGCLVLFLALLFYFTRPFPSHLRWIAALVSAIGILWLLLANRTKKEILKDVLRDLGIACIVAVVVTAIYEYSTRDIEKRETVLSMIDTAMAEFLPKTAWDEVKQEILRRNRVRRNVDIEFKISRKARLSSGKYITAPPGQVILWMKYGYDLVAVGPGAAYEPVQHELAHEMWNEDLQIPRFEKVTIIRDSGKQEDLYEGERLKRIYDGKSILLGPDVVQLPAPQLHQSVKIVSERYELMSAPGSYNLVMPELTVRGDGSTDPTIRVRVTELPPDLEIRLDTYYAAHKFTPAGGSDNSWVYNNLMLPGQGFSLIVKPKPRTSIGAPVVK
jgi:hypothetical protein